MLVSRSQTLFPADRERRAKKSRSARSAGKKGLAARDYAHVCMLVVNNMADCHGGVTVLYTYGHRYILSMDKITRYAISMSGTLALYKELSVNIPYLE